MKAIQIITFQPSLDEPEKRAAEKQLLRQNLGLLLENAEKIINTPEYFFCPLRTAFLSLAYINGGMMPLGALLLLWKEEKLIETCPDCSGKVYLFSAGGSPLSGSNSWGGICPACDRIRYGRSAHFSDIWLPMLESIKKYPNVDIIEKGERPKFSWSQGIVGKETPDVIIKPKVEGIPFEELIRVLKEGRI